MPEGISPLHSGSVSLPEDFCRQYSSADSKGREAGPRGPRWTRKKQPTFVLAGIMLVELLFFQPFSVSAINFEDIPKRLRGWNAHRVRKLDDSTAGAHISDTTMTATNTKPVAGYSRRLANAIAQGKGGTAQPNVHSRVTQPVSPTLAHAAEGAGFELSATNASKAPVYTSESINQPGLVSTTNSQTWTTPQTTSEPPRASQNSYGGYFSNQPPPNKNQSLTTTALNNYYENQSHGTSKPAWQKMPPESPLGDSYGTGTGTGTGHAQLDGLNSHTGDEESKQAKNLTQSPTITQIVGKESSWQGEETIEPSEGNSNAPLEGINSWEDESGERTPESPIEENYPVSPQKSWDAVPMERYTQEPSEIKNSVGGKNSWQHEAGKPTQEPNEDNIAQFDVINQYQIGDKEQTAEPRENTVEPKKDETSYEHTPAPIETIAVPQPLTMKPKAATGMPSESVPLVPLKEPSSQPTGMPYETIPPAPHEQPASFPPLQYETAPPAQQEYAVVASQSPTTAPEVKYPGIGANDIDNSLEMPSGTPEQETEMKKEWTGEETIEQLEKEEQEELEKEAKLEKELVREEREVRRIGGFGVLLAILAMIFTAHQMSENPDGT